MGVDAPSQRVAYPQTTTIKEVDRPPFILLTKKVGKNMFPSQDRRCGARAEDKLVCTLPSRKEEDEVRGDLGGG